MSYYKSILHERNIPGRKNSVTKKKNAIADTRFTAETIQILKKINEILDLEWSWSVFGAAMYIAATLFLVLHSS